MYDEHLRKKFGITAEDVARSFEKQNGKCPTCDTPLLFDRYTHVEHDHKTGVLRALTCYGCNMALGYTKENAAVLRRLADYVEFHNEAQIPEDYDTGAQAKADRDEWAYEQLGRELGLQ